MALSIPAPALAHVSVTPDKAAPGGFTPLAFRVPNERDNASTVEVEIFFPRDNPLEHASVKPVPGWTVSTTTRKLATPIRSDDGDVDTVVSSVVWKGGTIGVGQYQEFEVAVGPLPKRPTALVFKALQTYSNGEVVRWIDVPAEDGAEPEHPAPTLTVGGGAAAGGAVSRHDAAQPEGGSAASPVDTSARWLAGAGLVTAVLGLGVALLGRRRPSPKQRSGDGVAPTDPPVKMPASVQVPR